MSDIPLLPKGHTSITIPFQCAQVSVAGLPPGVHPVFDVPPYGYITIRRTRVAINELGSSEPPFYLNGQTEVTGLLMVTFGREPLTGILQPFDLMVVAFDPVDACVRTARFAGAHSVNLKHTPSGLWHIDMVIAAAQGWESKSKLAKREREHEAQ